MAATFGKRQSPEQPGADLGNESGGPPIGDAPSDVTPLRAWLRLALLSAAAGLIGFGIILWIAANWDGIDRFGRFAIVGSALAAAILLSLIHVARTPGLLLSFLAAGGLLALIGQTYQTGADPWQLFALWAALGLPWALAARSDVLWVAWTIVAFLALSLWQRALGGPNPISTDIGVTLLSWFFAVAITGALNPQTPLRPLIGETHWSFRIAALLTVTMVAGAGTVQVLMSPGADTVFWMAVILLAFGTWLLASNATLDLVLLGATGLGLLVLMLSGLGRWLMVFTRDPTLAFLVFGLLSAGAVAILGSRALKLARERGVLGPDGQTGEWPIILVTGLGALLASIPLAIFLFLAFGPLLQSGGSMMVLGVLFLVAAVLGIRVTQRTSFRHQLGAIGLALGFGLFAAGLTVLTKGSLAPVDSALFAVLAACLSFAVGPSWTASLLGAVAGGFTATFFSATFGWPVLGLPFGSWLRPIGWTILLTMCAAWIAWTAIDSSRRQNDRAFDVQASLERLVGGATLAGLLGLIVSAGPTFLLSGAMGAVGPRRHLTQAPELLGLTAFAPLSALLAIAGTALLLSQRRELATTLGIGASLMVVLLSAVIPQLGVLVLLVCVAMIAGRRVVGIGAFAAALWVIGSFYYTLSWPLADKAALMFSVGITLAVLCWLAGIRPPNLETGDVRPAPMAAAYALILSSAMATAGLANQTIATNEAILANGRQVFLALAPVDPRSLIQGDYMQLNFAVPREVLPQQRRRQAAIKPLSDYRWAVAELDHREVAEIVRLETERPTTIKAGQVILPIRYNARRWTIATDAWFFKEGSAKKFERAKYGVLRATTSGAALLEALADENLVIIK